MDVSIIFVNYKTRDLTINAINSVIEKTESISYEIFVVDNASNDGSIEAIEKQFPDINIIKSNKNGGFGYANNLAIKHAKGKYILCLNTDTLLVNNAIKIMFDYMEKDENQNVGVCGGYLIDRDGNPCMAGGHFPSCTEIIWKIGLRYIFRTIYNKYYAVGLNSEEIIKYNCSEQVIGADIFFRKTVLDEVGLFDENFFMYREETDLCKRIKNANYDIKLVENAIIIHFDGGSTIDDINKKLLFKESEMYYLKKHHTYKLFLIKYIYIFLYSFSYFFLKNNDSKKLLIFMVGY